MLEYLPSDYIDILRNVKIIDDPLSPYHFGLQLINQPYPIMTRVFTLQLGEENEIR
ncbi:hypothetical protein [Aliivibrio logei]|uniref:hypothetical protein n=1 Tax=Aliivibrio logei TaxID=688 RepID=UPI00037E9F89|nr:hypothetical protein [Aliivibrio logei]